VLSVNGAIISCFKSQVNSFLARKDPKIAVSKAPFSSIRSSVPQFGRAGFVEKTSKIARFRFVLTPGAKFSRLVAVLILQPVQHGVEEL